MRCHQFTHSRTRRAMLRSTASGFGGLALSALAAHSNPLMAALNGMQPLPNPPIPHLAARAKRLIFLFMWGGPSHVDLFDPKPRLNTSSGKPLAGSDVGDKRDQLGQILGSPFKLARHGQGGVWISVFAFLTAGAIASSRSKARRGLIATFAWGAAGLIMLAADGMHWLAIVAFILSATSLGFENFVFPRRFEWDLFDRDEDGERIKVVHH